MHRIPQIPAITAAVRRVLPLALLTLSFLAVAHDGLQSQTPPAQKSEDLGPCPRDKTGAIDGDLSDLVGAVDPKKLKDPCYRWLNGLDKPAQKGNAAPVTPVPARPAPGTEDEGPPLSEGDAEQALQEALARGASIGGEKLTDLYTPWITNEVVQHAEAQAGRAGAKLTELILERARRDGNPHSDEDIIDDNASMIGEFKHIAFLAEMRGPENEPLFPAVVAMMPVAAKMAIAATTDTDARRALQRLMAMLIGMDAAALATRTSTVLP